MSFDGWACAISVLLFKRNGHCDALKVLIGYCHSKGSLFINPLGTVCGVILSLTTEVKCISVFPGFWKYLPMILVQELPMTASAAYINSLVHVGICSLYAGHDSHVRSCRP